jgi:hypothetical protein
LNELPNWPAGTVAILATGGDRPHAIPVSAVVRGGPRLVFVGLARTRESLSRLRRQPRVTLAIVAAGLAVSVDGLARVVQEDLVDGVAAVAVDVESVSDHLRPTFEIEAGVRWHWTDPGAAGRDAEVQAALGRLAVSPDDVDAQ